MGSEYIRNIRKQTPTFLVVVLFALGVGIYGGATDVVGYIDNIEFIGSTTYANQATTTETSLVLNKPAGTVEGDLMIQSMMHGGLGDPSVTAPLGWTLLHQNLVESTGKFSVFYKTATDSEPSSYTWTISSGKHFAAGISTYRNVHTTSPFHIQDSKHATNATEVTLSLTTTIDNSYFVSFAASSVTNPGFTPDSSLIERYDLAQFDNKTVGSFDEPLPTAGLISRTIRLDDTVAASDIFAFGIALKPKDTVTIPTTGSLTDNLTYYLPNENSSVGTSLDAHTADGLANNFTEGGTVTEGVGIQGNGAVFNNSGDLLYRASEADLDGSNTDFSIALWVKPNASSAARRIFSKQGPESNLSAGSDYRITISSADAAELNMGDGTTGLIAVTSNGAVIEGQWNLILGWVDRTANTMNIQVNNGTVYSIPLTITPKNTGPYVVMGRNRQNATAGYYSGVIDEVAFWKRILTSEERSQIWNNGSGYFYDQWVQADEEPEEPDPVATSTPPVDEDPILGAYYVSPSGNDNNSGTSPAEAWQTLSKVSSSNFQPGSMILLEGSVTHSGGISFPAGSCGTPEAPITISSYGAGRATIVSGRGQDGIFVYNCAGFNISNINFVGEGIDQPETTANRQTGGIKFYADSPLKFDHLKIQDIGAQKYAYGISIGSWNGQAAGFRNVTLERIETYNNLRDGINIYSELPLAHENVTVRYTKSYNNKGIAGIPHPTGGNGIVLGGVNGGLIERSLAHDNGGNNEDPAGPVGIWAYDSNNILIQFNESYKNRTGSFGDGDGFDFDQNTTNSIMQYNYSHENDGAGYLLAHAPSTGSNDGNIVRYNISYNDARKLGYGGIQVWGRVTNTEIYNNTVYMTPNGTTRKPIGIFVSNASIPGHYVSSLHIRNNIFQIKNALDLVFVEAGQLAGATDLLFQGNNYFSTGSSFRIHWGAKFYSSLYGWRTATGQEKINGIASGYSVNPQLTSPGTAGTIGDPDKLNTLTAFKIKSTSPMKNKGLNLVQKFGLDAARHPGLQDFYDGLIPKNTYFDIGVHEGF